VKQAFEMKEQGNQFFKEKDYKRALAKYARVQCYTNAILPSKDSQVQMLTGMSKKSQAQFTTEEEGEEVRDLLCTTYANMAQCFLMT
jgi:hypothetical protein